MQKGTFSELTFRLKGRRADWTSSSARWLLAGALVWMLPLFSAGLVAGQAGPVGGQEPSGTHSAGGVPTFTVPSKTELFLRLKTPVSTTSSHLNETVEAATERAVEVNGET